MLLSEIVEEIERLFEDKYANDTNVISAFVIGSMASNTYVEKSNNDYDIRIVVNKVTRKFLLEFEQFLKQLCMLSNDIEIEYDSSIGPVFHKSQKERRLLLHALVLTCDIIDTLPKSHRLTYSLNYRNIFGVDILEKYKSISLSIEDIVYCREGLIDCRNMLKNGLILPSVIPNMKDGEVSLKKIRTFLRLSKKASSPLMSAQHIRRKSTAS